MPAPHLTRFLASAGLLVFLPHLRADDAADRQRLLTDVVDSNRKAIGSIRTIEFRIEKTDEKHTPAPNATPAFPGVDPSTPVGPRHYWEAGDRSRHRYKNTSGTTNDQVLQSARVLRLVWPTGSPPQLVRAWDFYDQARSELQVLLFTHPGREPAVFAPLHTLLEQPHTFDAVERLPPTPDEPAGEIRLGLTHDLGRLDLWFSPKRNHLIRKRSVVWHATPHHRCDWEVVAFAEPEPGVFVPTVIDVRHTDKDRGTDVYREVVSALRVNHPPADDAFRLPDVAGMECRDQTTQTAYKVDRDGHRDGPAVDLASLTPPRPPQSTPTSDLMQWTVGELLNTWWVWGIAVSLGLVAAAAGLEILRLRKLVRGGPPDGTVGRT